MPSGTGITNLNNDLQNTPPTAGKGILAGDSLYINLILAQRITVEDYQLTGSTFKFTHTTLDKKYPIAIDPNIGLDDYRYI